MKSSTYQAITVNHHLSDHLAQRLELQTTEIPEKEKYEFIRIINENNTYHFRERLKNVDWEFIKNMSAPLSCNGFHKAVTDTFNQCFPEKRIKIRSVPPKKYWERPEIIELKKKVDAAHTIFSVERNENTEKLYTKLKHQLTQLIESTIKTENTQILNESSNKNRAIWKFINSKIKGKTKTNNAKLLSEEDFSVYFSTIAEKVGRQDSAPETSDDFLKKKIIRNPKSFFLTPTTPEEVKRAVSEMKKKTSRDIYGFSVSLLKEVIDYLADPLSELINSCFQKGYFPDEMKLARVIPIYKKGDQELCHNYRPISLLPAMSKIFESLKKSRLVSFLESHSLLSDHQHGFRRSGSTTSALVQIIEFVLQSLDDSEEAILTCMDLTKAFDCVNHEKLLSKLEYIGIRGQAFELFRSYLLNRYQIVDVSGKKSSRRCIATGIIIIIPGLSGAFHMLDNYFLMSASIPISKSWKDNVFTVYNNTEAQIENSSALCFTEFLDSGIKDNPQL
ncbi:uncharacterized protein LOC123680892 [Harmonia axyridis]|uniref:uncharacterized protein LOC123680892 n=1 Tax=Harmonia axyridis TaxID=115357 RepID=UPI001E2790C1|nr:uncharacterized protein LOC123680892 [Harmonia axyridis]